eukprot:1876093-Amphidinium_carterae.1
MDPQMSFAGHVTDLKQKLHSRCLLLKRLHGASWAPPLDVIVDTARAWILSLSDYCSASWFYWLSTAQKDHVESAEAHVLRTALSVMPSAATPLVHLESGVLPLCWRALHGAIRLYVAGVHLPPHAALHKALQGPARAHPGRGGCGWRTQVEHVLADLFPDPVLPPCRVPDEYSTADWKRSSLHAIAS